MQFRIHRYFLVVWGGGWVRQCPLWSPNACLALRPYSSLLQQAFHINESTLNFATMARTIDPSKVNNPTLKCLWRGHKKRVTVQ